MHFIPNPANTEFICLLGLEECVSKILNEDKENSIQPVPFSCSQCGTDFTPTWKWDKGAKGESDQHSNSIQFSLQTLITGKEVKVICENCVTTNVKKALKAEHTNRLKAAFVKALQQEQELEAHMAAQASSASASSSSTSATTAARIASPDTRGRNSVDVTVRPASRSIPSAHQQPRSSLTSAATVERAPYRSSQHLPSSSRNTAASVTSSSLGSSSRTNNSSRSYNNGGLPSSSSRSTNSSSSKNDLNNANAMAAQVAALMGMGAYGSDPAAATSMALLQAAAAQQQLLMGYGNTSTTSSNSRGSSSNHTSSTAGSASSRSAASANSSNNDINSQIMNQLLNPNAMAQMYNYQAMAAMMAAMGGGGGGGGSSGGSSATKSSSSGSSSSSSATNQMLELQRQAERLQQQYMLEMIQPGSLGSWGASASGKK